MENVFSFSTALLESFLNKDTRWQYLSTLYFSYIPWEILENFWRPFFISQAFTNAISLPLNSSISSKHVFIAVSDFGARKKSFETWQFRFSFPYATNAKVKLPTPGKTLPVKFPTPRAQKIVKCPGFAPGEGMLKFRFDGRIIEAATIACVLLAWRMGMGAMKFEIWMWNFTAPLPILRAASPLVNLPLAPTIPPTNLVPRVSLLCLHCQRQCLHCHCQPRSQGLSSLPPLSTTMEAEKRNPWNEVDRQLRRLL